MIVETTRARVPSRRRQGWLRGALLFVGLVGATGCVDERAFYIVQNQVPNSDCTIPATVGDVYRGRGTLDLRGNQGYSLFPVMTNELIPTAGTDDEPERNRIYLRRFDVNLDLGSLGGGLPGELTSFSVAASGAMQPGESRSSIVEIIPDALVPILRSRYSAPLGARPTVMASVQAVADHNGHEIKSYTFEYPVELCDGCLIIELADCPAAGDETTIADNACGIPQDQPVTCCNDATRGFICLSSATTQ